jgi:hypothetical protein
VATFAGRVVTPEDKSVAEVMKRFPMGTGEGDLPSALQATAGQFALPALQTSSSLLTKALASALPKALATIGPATYRNPVTDAWARLLKYTTPKLYKKLVEHPMEVEFKMAGMEELPRSWGTLHTMDPRHQLLRVRADVPTEGPSVLRDVLAHEVQHALNEPRLRKMAPEDAATIGFLLNDVLKEQGAHRTSLSNRIQEYVENFVSHDPGLPSPNPKWPVVRTKPPRSWKSLTPKEKAEFTVDEMKHEPIYRQVYDPVRAYGTTMPYSDFLHRIIADEALAHLAEAALPPMPDPFVTIRTPGFGQSPQRALLQKLASELKVGEVE